ncbi:MAG: Gfo/Idh/MocA family oxidoreductase [Kiritimatiellae bacterium]|nr:Gfo/Idh/MocA family oxidoreductase [Kiritimatiellia bacterium]
MKSGQTERRVRVGVVGVGSLGQHHARIYSTLPAAELVGVYDIDQRRAGEVARACSARAFPTLEELAGAVEAVSVAVPAHKHFEVFMQLAQFGIHILMEKPIAACAEEAEKMVHIAQDRGLILQVGHVERFNPVMKFLETHLAQPRFIEAIRLSPYPPPRQNAPPRGTEVSVVLDMMIHDLEIILHLVRSEVKEIHAVGVPVLSPTEDIANTRLVFTNGCIANVTASRVSRERMRKIRVFQHDSYVSLDYLAQTGTLCRKVENRIEVTPVPITRSDPLTEELSAFVHTVLKKSVPVVTGEEGFRAVRLALDICRQIATNPS